MNSYKKSAFMIGLLFLLGTVFGVLSTIVGGETMASLVQKKPIDDLNIVELVSQNQTEILYGSFLVLLMGISLIAMTVFLYPIMKKDSPVLATTMLLFRGAMEGLWYFITTISFIFLLALGVEYAKPLANIEVLSSIGNAVYYYLNLLGPLGTIMFLIGTTCIYVSFYRTKIIPRWLSIWGLIGVAPYFVYAIIHFFGVDNGIGFYLQMILAPQELVMALWLIIKGFNNVEIKALMK